MFSVPYFPKARPVRFFRLDSRRGVRFCEPAPVLPSRRPIGTNSREQGRRSQAFTLPHPSGLPRWPRPFKLCTFRVSYGGNCCEGMVWHGARRVHDADLADCLFPRRQRRLWASHRAGNAAGRSGRRLNAAGADGRKDFVAEGGGHANHLARSARSAARVAALLRGVDAEQRAVGFVREQVEQAVGALADVADAVVEVAEDPFAVEFFPLIVEIDTLQVTRPRDFAFTHPADEQIVFPVGIAVAGIEVQAGDGYGGNPVYDGGLHTFFIRIERDARAGIDASVADDGPAVVLAGGEDVHFVPAVGPIFAGPNLTCDGIDVHTENVAMADGEDFGFRSGPIDERVVGRNGAVVAQTEHFPSEVPGILGGHGHRGRRIATGADVHVDHPVAAEDDA